MIYRKVLLVALALPFLCGILFLHQDRLVLKTVVINELLKGDQLVSRNIINDTSIGRDDIIAANAIGTESPRSETSISEFANRATNQSLNLAASHTKNMDETLSSSFFVNNIMTTHGPQNSSCLRTCVDFRNKIYLSDNPWKEGSGAGLIDRLTMFGTLLNMAGSLCAYVYVPRPRFLLGPMHNFNKTLSPNMSWSEFGEFTLWNDPKQQPALIDWDNPQDVAKWPEEATLLKEHTAMLKLSERPRHVRFDFIALQSYTRDQQQKLVTSRKSQANGFIWIIKAEYDEWSNLMAGNLRRRPPPKSQAEEHELHQTPFIFAPNGFFKGCQYAKAGLTQSLQDLRNKIVNQIVRLPQSDSESMPLSTTLSSVSPPLVGYLHIRRKDSSRMCKTSMVRLALYLNCSLGEAVTRLSESSSRTTRSWRRVIVLYSTDDDRPEYRRDAAKLIEEQQLRSLDHNPIQVTAVDLDQIVERTVRTEMEAGSIPEWRFNNYYIFQLIFSIGYNQTISQFHMERRRALDCRACDNVTEQLIQSSALQVS